MKTIACARCGGELRVPDSLRSGRGECPLCGARFAVASASEVEETHGSSPWRAELARFIKLPRFSWPLGGPGLRRCVRCSRNLFHAPVSCPYCGGETVGGDFVAVYDGSDRALQAAFLDFQRHAKVLNFYVAAIWAAAAAMVLILLVKIMGNRYWVVNIVFFLLFASPVFVAAVWLNRRAILLIGDRFSLRHPAAPTSADGRPPPRLAEKLERARTHWVEPFLERHGVEENAPIRASEEELGLLAQLLNRDDLPCSPDRLVELLTSCALRRDLERFRRRLETREDADRSPIAAYASLHPVESSADEGQLPLLRQTLADRGRIADEPQVEAALRRIRHDLKLKTFERELREGGAGASARAGLAVRPSPVAAIAVGPGVTIGRIDAMNPESFDSLMGLVYRSLGFEVEETPRVGDGGVDVILARAGDRTVLQTRLDNQPVGLNPVRQAVAARLYYRCSRAIVVTNHHFTPAAIDLAADERVELVDRRGLIAMLDPLNRAPGVDHDRLDSLLEARVRLG